MQLSEKYSNNPALICAFEPDLFSPPAAVNFDERGCKDAGADALVLMTAHREFRELDLRRVRESMRTPIIIDGRRVFDQSLASGGRVHVLLRNTWARSREPAGFRSRRVRHFGWTILKQDEVRGLGFVYRGVGVGI